MFGTTLNRMIFWELVRVFLLSLGSLTGLVLVVMSVQQASQLGLSLAQLVRAVPLLVPSILPIAIPATTLFAACVVYGRLAHDNEVIALKAAGVHLFGIVKPTLLLGVLTTATTAALAHSTIPRTQQMFWDEILSDPEEVLYNMIRRDRCLRHPSLPNVLYVRDVEGKRLIDVVVKRRIKEKDPRTGAEVVMGYDMVARMHEAQLRVDVAAGTLSIEPDRLVIDGKNASGSAASSGAFVMDLPDSVTGKEARLKTSTLTWDELPERAAGVAAKLDRITRERAARQAEINQMDPNLRANAQAQIEGYNFEIAGTTKQLRNLQAEVHARPALAVSCLVFALVGCPVGVYLNRSDYLSTFMMCFLPTLLVYYPLLLAGTDMGKSGRLPMALGCWAADIVMGAVGVLLAWRLLRR
ncbi:putative permease YjgP/YjgQ family protein [Gemmata obscuriglobus]|uniref:LptF/LptG family permease n=1 Tax=Gemmata obscuriglobus TaxID=114 RepID=A0A2Z3HK51_9BACT|nr:LptF/LptG family permease [Gemmata obscuriglobus]AWM41840.1 LptF/LptG family permease [Gemmata obscuriglobus]QEG32194.1 putative permease YjgP/YjgQ family protein [Gemmata obscuriglobus]VTS11547.1 permease family protein : Putative permease OS=Singulisphaera acidiphila (strain ATCC BAA-1392 / DSM 18658 / VKM B-2454 / MOB10) GN=Sinac_2241 PE=4 SV=1: YjgP_YjgQ [Gemmata obscuriglobus UQM 2246]